MTQQATDSTTPASVLAVGPNPATAPAQAQAVGALTEALERAGWLAVSLVSVTDRGVPALGEVVGSGFDAVLLLTAVDEALAEAQWKGLGRFIEQGGSLIATQPAVASARRDSQLARWLGVHAVREPTAPFPYPVRFEAEAQSDQAPHPVVARAQGFTITDSLLLVEAADDTRTLATTHLDHQRLPVAVAQQTKTHHAIALALGGEPASLEHPSVLQMIERSIRAVTRPPDKTHVSVGLLGYGGTFNMGRNHVQWMGPATGLQVEAVCDVDETRTEQAKQDLGDHIRTYNDMQRLFGDDQIELIVMILPHDAHADPAIAALNAGKHVVIEKPFALTLDDADRMIEAADKAGVMLSCFHNHRWDGDLMRLRQMIRADEVGTVYHIDVGTAHFMPPKPWWRSSKRVSGGVLYDWGAHHVDALLSVMQKRIESVSGHLQKRYWHNMTNEDFARVMIRFEDGTTASLEQGELAAIERPRWRVLGTMGGLSAQGENQPIHSVKPHEPTRRESTVEAHPSDWPAYYRNIANHLLMGEPLAVTPQQARRVTGVLELAERSSNQGGTPLSLPGEDSIDPVYRAPTA